MADMKYLYDTIRGKAFELELPFPKIPQYILENLKYNFFDWQTAAFKNFLTFQSVKAKKNPNELTHLMFNMATGTGKTLLMASAILYYYQQGYRHFLFFVNQKNIVDKTENNFINNSHNKYLFKEKIAIDDKIISIKKVDNFSNSPDGIEIKFTTIQKLHNDVHLEKEGNTTLQDLHKKNIIMLADEAQHFEADTKNIGVQGELIPKRLTDKSSAKEIEKKGWEDTIINLILKKDNKSIENRNVLLEFTATIPEYESVAKKYEDKIIYKYDLKDFLQAGYTKEINLISSSLGKKERILQALLFAYYRHKIALKHNIANFKPVILFRSKTIEESEKDHKEFLDLTDNLNTDDFGFFKTITDKIFASKNAYEQGRSRTEELSKFIETEKISFSEIANWIKQSYQDRNVIITNSKDNKSKSKKTDEDIEIDKQLNSLEDKNNNIRAIFTVQRLTEGWDVLNLFDIVRLYQGQNAGGSNTKTPKVTIAEKQLIGRGVRYFPFSYKDKLSNKRKFDDDLNNELRILEELYYYTYDEESKYISDLKKELKKDGYISDDKIAKTFSLKKGFEDSDFYNNVKIWYNKQLDNPKRKKKNFDDIKNNFSFKHKIISLEMGEHGIDWDNEDNGKDNLDYKEDNIGLKTTTIKFNCIEKHIIDKAINIKANQTGSLLQFEKIKKELDIHSIDQLHSAKLADFELEITADKNVKYEDIDSKEKLKITIKFLNQFIAEFKQEITPKIGGDFIAGNFKEFFGNPKVKMIQKDKDSNDYFKELAGHKWYVLDSFCGTDQEQALIEFIEKNIGNLEGKYQEIYLLRNEEVYKIYDFEKGRGFQPDFILFLRNKEKQEDGTEIYYQIFIEPKQKKYMDSGSEIWKEKFLAEISKKYECGVENIISAENPDYRLIGLPFFNSEKNKMLSFEQAFKNKVLAE